MGIRRLNARAVFCATCVLRTLQVCRSFILFSRTFGGRFLYFSHTTRARGCRDVLGEWKIIYIIILKRLWRDSSVPSPCSPFFFLGFLSFLLYCFFDQIHLLAHKCTNNITLKRRAYNFLRYLHLLFTRTLVKSMYLFVYDNNIYCTCGFRDF